MADATMLDQIRPRMKVHTSDGKHLGTVRLVHQREGATYVEVTPCGSLWNIRQLFLGVKRVFLPGDTITSVSEKQVQIAMDAKTAKGCTWRPSWISQEVDDPEVITKLGAG